MHKTRPIFFSGHVSAGCRRAGSAASLPSGELSRAGAIWWRPAAAMTAIPPATCRKTASARSRVADRDAIGWQGAWGTTYPANLRLLFQQIDEKTWLARARQAMRPPMPSPVPAGHERRRPQGDYRYVRHLGAKGQPVPAYVPPGEKVTTPYFDFTPKNLPPGLIDQVRYSALIFT